MSTITLPRKHIVSISHEQMRMVDYMMENRYGIHLSQLTEVCGRALATVSRQRFSGGNVKDKKIAVLAGPGGNGACAIVAARRLKNWGADVELYLTTHENHYKPHTADQLKIARHMKVPVQYGEELHNTDRFALIIDGIFGYGMQGAPTGMAKYVIDWANFQQCPVVSLDVPTGLGPVHGNINKPTIVADATLVLAFPKDVLFAAGAESFVGELYLADIGIPPEIYHELNIPDDVHSYFAESDIVHVVVPDIHPVSAMLVG